MERIKFLVEQLEELSTYKVDVDSEGFMYVERSSEGRFVDAYSVECIVAELKKQLANV